MHQVNQYQKVKLWLWLGVFMLLIQIMLGGITRLTKSGLSITEWNPLMGILPPLNYASWQQSFKKYQQIAQFKKVNYAFSFADYKSIFIWEWLHREWARLMGIFFVVPFIIFIVNRQINKSIIIPMLILFLLGALQGAIGWLMVKSGLNDTDISVAPVCLAIHFICALFLLSYLLWFALKLSIPATALLHPSKLNIINCLLLLLLAVQLFYGAIMAGSHAALYAPTWPDINGSFIPPGIFAGPGLFHKLIYNPFAIQLVHRSVAYLIAITTICWFLQARKWPRNSLIYKYRSIPPFLVVTQIMLGVLALTGSMLPASIYFAALHQLAAVLLLSSVITSKFCSTNQNGRNE